MHQHSQNVIGMTEKSNSPLFGTSNDDNIEDRAINEGVPNQHSNDTKNNATNGQLMHPNVGATAASIHEQNNIPPVATFNRTIGSRQSSPTDEVANNVLHAGGGGGGVEKLNSVAHSSVQNNAVQQINISKESVSSSGLLPNAAGHSVSAPAPSQQINIDTSSFAGQVRILNFR